MLKNFNFVIFLTLTNILVSNGQTPEWLNKVLQIKPLKSTEKDIEKIMGKPVKSYANIKEYETNKWRAYISYSSGKCNEKEVTVTDRYDAEIGTVININLRLKDGINFKKMKADLSGFKKEVPNDTQSGADYTNYDLGISYITSNGRLYDLIVFPKKDLDSLLCKK